MLAAVADGNGLELREVARPEPKPDQVLVKVRLVGLNRADLLATARARPGDAVIPGIDFMGEVAAVGANVGHLKPGDRVMGSGRATYAEYVAADRGRVDAIPAGLAEEQAAALPLALLTMHDAVVGQGRLRPGEAALILGASSGVGLMGLQIARFKGASPVIGTSTTAERRARLAEYGADLALDTGEDGWPAAAREATGGKGVDVIVDQIAGRAVNQALQAAAVLARIVNVGRMAGGKGDFDFNEHALKRISYIGVTFRTRSPEEVRALADAMRADLWDAVAAGAFRLPVDCVMPFAEANAAQARMRANAHFGKILLRLP